MRVTKTIKEYITKKVNEAYQPKLNEIDLQYKCDREKMIMRIKSAVAECEEKIKAIVADSGDGWSYQPYNYGYHSSEDGYLAFHEPRDKEAEVRFRDIKNNLTAEKNEKIEEIIVALELGGNKDTLDEMLKNL
jgi:hypothetical protein